MIANKPMVAGSSPECMSVVFYDEAITYCLLQKQQHSKILWSFRVSKVVMFLISGTVLQGRIAGRLFGSVFSLAIMVGMMGTLVVARGSTSVGGTSDEVDSLSNVLGSSSESESEQGFVVVDGKESASSSWDTAGIVA